MKQTKGFAQIAILVVIGVLVVGGIAYVVAKNPRDVANNTNTTPPPASSGLQTYVNSKYGFSFSYPSGWNIQTNLETGVNIISTSQDQIAAHVYLENPLNPLRGVHNISKEDPYAFQGINGTKLTGESGVTGKPVNILIVKFGNNFLSVNTPPELFSQIINSLKLSPPVGSVNILTQSAALALVKSTWGDCTPDSCSEVIVSVGKQGSATYVTATYEGLRDDSSSAQRKVAIATYVNGKWTLGTPTVTQRCQPGRGHQDFSAEPCI